MTADQYLAFLRRWGLVLVAVGAVAGLLATIALSARPVLHEASTTLIVGELNQDTDALRASTELVGTYGDLLVGTPLLTEATVAVPGTSVATLRDRSEVAFNSETRLITLTVRDEAPRVAVAVAGFLAQRLVESTTTGGVRPFGEVRVVSPPVAGQVESSAIVLVGLAVVAAVLAAMVVASVVDSSRDVVRSPRELADRTGVPVLATVRLPRPRSAAALGPSDPGLRVLATHLDLAVDGAPARCVAVLGGDGHEDGRALASGLAEALAGGGRRVLLVQTQRPRRGGRPDDGPWGEALFIGGALADDRGPAVVEAAGLLTLLDPARTPAVGEVVRNLEPLLDLADVVVLAPGPVMASAALAVAAAADAVLVSTRRGRSRWVPVAASVEAVQLVMGRRAVRRHRGLSTAPSLGLVLTTGGRSPHTARWQLVLPEYVGAPSAEPVHPRSP